MFGHRELADIGLASVEAVLGLDLRTPGEEAASVRRPALSSEAVGSGG
jgi:hypothetical protein